MEYYWNNTEYDKLSGIEFTKILGDVKVPKDITNKKIADEFFESVKTMDIGLDDSAEVKQINDRIIHVSYGKNLAKMTLDDSKKKATIEINEIQIPDKLRVKNENNIINIYKYTDKQISSWADIIIRFFEIKPGHKVMVYGKSFHINAMAEVIGEYEFKELFDFPHIKSVKWLQIFKKPLDINPILSKLEKQAFRPTVVDISKKDWDTIFNYAKQVGGIEEKSEEKTTSDEILKNLFNQARIELGSNRNLILDDVISKMQKISEAKGLHLSNNWKNVTKEKIKNEWSRDKPGTKLI